MSLHCTLILHKYILWYLNISILQSVMMKFVKLRRIIKIISHQCYSQYFSYKSFIQDSLQFWWLSFAISRHPWQLWVMCGRSDFVPHTQDPLSKHPIASHWLKCILHNRELCGSEMNAFFARHAKVHLESVPQFSKNPTLFLFAMCISIMI